MIADKSVAVVDIDGVLNSYPKCFFDWAKVNCHVDWATMHQARQDARYTDIKQQYRLSGVKRNLAVLPGARDMLNLLKSQGHKIIIVTSRPDIGTVHLDTKYWLEKNNLPFDAVIFGRVKPRALLDVDCDLHEIGVIIDDEERHLKDYFSVVGEECNYIRISQDQEMTEEGLSFYSNFSNLENLIKWLANEITPDKT